MKSKPFKTPVQRLVTIVLDEAVSDLKSIPIIMVFPGEMKNFMTSKSMRVKYSVGINY